MCSYGWLNVGPSHATFKRIQALIEPVELLTQGSPLDPGGSSTDSR